MQNTAFLSKSVDENIIFTHYWKVLVLNFLEMGNTVFFEATSWWKDDIYRLLKSSCFELFRDGKYGLSLSQKLDKRWCILITEKFVFWSFQWREVRSFFFFSVKKLMERLYLFGLFEFSMIFQDLGNMVFRAVPVSFTYKSFNIWNSF